MLNLPPDLAQQVTIALVEDIGSGDVTAELVPADQRVTGKVISREPAILCGRPWVTEVFRQLDPSVHLTGTGSPQIKLSSRLPALPDRCSPASGPPSISCSSCPAPLPPHAATWRPS